VIRSPRRRQRRPRFHEEIKGLSHKIGFSLALLILLCLPTLLYGVEYSVVPTVSLREEVNDNILMTAQPHDTVWGSHLIPSLRLSAAMERWRVDGNFWASLSRYVGEEGLDMNEASLKLSSEYSTERDRWRWFGEATRDAAWKSELEETGLIFGVQRRNVGVLGGSWSRTLTERTTLRGEVEYRETRYDREGGLFDFDAFLGSVQTIYSLSEKDQLRTHLQLLSYRAPSVGVESKNVGLQISWVHPFSETFQGTFSVGGRELFTEFSLGGETEKEREFGWLAGAMILKRWERTSLRGGAVRQVDPSGGGYLIEVNRLSSVIEQQLTQTTSGSLAAYFYRTRPLRGDLSPPDGTSFSIEPRWLWNWNEAWSMLIGYRYAWLKRDDGNDPIYSNSITWMLTYHGLGWSMSR
jgi:hypothetical protein